MKRYYDDDGLQPVVIDDSLLYPLLILVVSMLLVPSAVARLFDVFVGSSTLSEADAGALRSGLSLIAQGASLVFLTINRVGSSNGLGLPLRSLGLPFRMQGSTAAPNWGREVAFGAMAGFGLTALNVAGAWLSRVVLALFIDGETLAEYVAAETDAVANALGAGGSPWILLLLPVVAVVVAPIAEEVFFRGYLYAVFRSKFTRDPWYALYWSSAVFAVVHFYVIHFIPVFLIGLALGYLYRRRGFLIAPVVAHATANLLVTVATLSTQAFG